MCFTKIIVISRLRVSLNVTLKVARCCCNYSLSAYNGTDGVFQEDEDVPSVNRNRNLKYFVKRSPSEIVASRTIIPAAREVLFVVALVAER